MKKIAMVLMAAITFAGLLSGCKKTEIRQSTTDDVNIYEFLQQDPQGRFVELVKLVDRAGYQSFLNAYGTYTLFAPTNSALQAYYQTVGKGSADQFSEQEAKDLLKFHLLGEEVLTSYFNDGKLNAQTMFGQYLVTGVENNDGGSVFVVNRQAQVEEANLKTGNGVIQVINAVLTPSQKSLAKLVEEDPQYSIFTQALKETGWFAKLDQPVAPNGEGWYTLIAETNQALADTGIASYADLKAKYCNTGNPANEQDSLYLFVAYHILPEIKFLADIAMASSHETKAPLEVVTSKVINKNVFINDDEYTGSDGLVHEPGIELPVALSDRTATNGVLHHSPKHLAIKVRSPFPVYWDLCATQPELTRLSNVYGKTTYLFDYADGNAFKDLKWEKSCLKYRHGVKGVNSDYWQMGMGRSSSNTNSLGTCSGNAWIEFTTPLLVKGRYKVWFCYYAQNSTATSVQGSFNGIPLTSGLINFAQKIASVGKDGDPAVKEKEMEALGWKWWAPASEAAGATAARLLGIVDVETTGRHKIRFDLISGSNADCNFDMVHFIPIDMDQTRRRFYRNGTYTEEGY